jgi:hypothetical protein
MPIPSIGMLFPIDSAGSRFSADGESMRLSFATDSPFPPELLKSRGNHRRRQANTHKQISNGTSHSNMPRSYSVFTLSAPGLPLEALHIGSHLLM